MDFQKEIAFLVNGVVATDIDAVQPPRPEPIVESSTNLANGHQDMSNCEEMPLDANKRRRFNADATLNEPVTDISTRLARFNRTLETPARMIPWTLHMKDSDKFDYYTKNVKITYPDNGSSVSMVIPGVVLHCDTFNHFGKTGAYIGIPKQLTDMLTNKFIAVRQHAVIDYPTVASDDRYWWAKQGFGAAEAEKEYVYVVDEDNGEIVEDAFPSFPELFNTVGVTCALKMRAKLSVAKKGAFTAEDELRMGISVSRANITDIVDVDKPLSGLIQHSIAGTKDKASALLQESKPQHLYTRHSLEKEISPLRFCVRDSMKQ
ncbi:hypothetical protein K470DRAFT_262721 [Piedraia hortae CBS 480.64]|uniref:Uncharacterized protein n=1 Tax=Piedraia hortae CBS 480.64 TaxID=1314780 RepID=A0A6A7C5F1_9PEZI|nr:hypothetical protein K470DRAFT_262721 [Piedraia hortae CBS 480.64]